MTITESLIHKVDELPATPGCYIWRDEKDKILYIGKAKNLRKRVSSYIQNYDRLDPKIRSMIDQVTNVEHHTVDSEVEALILETNLIKKYRPKYNRLMKDDKNYSWVAIDWYRNYPRISVVRDKFDKKSEYFGPYPARFPVFKVLGRLRKIFPYCEHMPYSINSSEPKFNEKPCFNFHIGLCTGVCANFVSKTVHRKNINGIRKFFKGMKSEIVEELKKEIAIKSNELKFEEAAALRDRLNDLNYVLQHITIDRDIDEMKLIEMKNERKERALRELLEKIDFKNIRLKDEFKMECFDISNIQGTNPVASMVVFVNGEPRKDLYRKFKIRSKSTPDDYAMMKEAISRRFTHSEEDKSFSTLPDLLIVDGGKGQLASAHAILDELNLLDKVPLISLAKRLEEIFKVQSFDRAKNSFEFDLIRLARRSESLYLIQRIRDEAHRFAITFHRKLRSKAQTKSLVEDIPGVGPAIRKKLLESFLTFDLLSKASLDEISAIIKNKTTAKNIFSFFRKKSN